MVKLKILQRGLKKEDITLAKRYPKWYKVMDNEIRVFVNESSISKKADVVNTIDYKNNKAYICMADVETSNKFYEKHKELKLRLYIKSEVGNLYNEYQVTKWYSGEKGLEVALA